MGKNESVCVSNWGDFDICFADSWLFNSARDSICCYFSSWRRITWCEQRVRKKQVSSRSWIWSTRPELWKLRVCLRVGPQMKCECCWATFSFWKPGHSWHSSPLSLWFFDFFFPFVNCFPDPITVGTHNQLNQHFLEIFDNSFQLVKLIRILLFFYSLYYPFHCIQVSCLFDPMIYFWTYL